MAKPRWRQILLSLTAFSKVASKEGKPRSCACSVFIQEDGCMQLFTYGIRKIIVCLVLIVFSRFPCGWFCWNQQKMKEFQLCQQWSFRSSRGKIRYTEVFAVLPSWNDEKKECSLRQKVTVMTWKMVEKIWILSENIFGESLTKCVPRGHEKTVIKRKSSEPFFKYGSLRLRPAGSDPGAGRQKILFLKVGVFLSGFAPSVAHEKLSVRGRRVQATKNKAETCSLLDAIRRRSCGRRRGWV